MGKDWGKKNPKKIPKGRQMDGNMDGIGKELETNRTIQSSRIKSSGHRMWKGAYEGFQNRDQCLSLFQSLFETVVW